MSDRDLLRECKLQLEYLNEKFKETGTTNALLSKIDTQLRKGEMPLSLTAENGAKGLLNGEYFETIEVDNEDYCGCGNCDYCIDFPDNEPTVTLNVPVECTTIKDIYSKIVDHYTK